MVVHLIYVLGNRISTPHAITNELVKRFSKKYQFKVYDWADTSSITPSEGDILIGHPHPLKNTIFRNSFWKNGWAKRIIMSPFAHAMPEYIAFIDPLIPDADQYLAICGKYWIDTISDSLTSHWQPKITHLDLAVNTTHFPFIKTKFGNPGKRKFLYIGHTAPYKGSDYLSALAEANADLHIGWIGRGWMPSSRIIAHGQHNFCETSSSKLIEGYDFLLTCGRSDANPTTILEAASWGLIPICTPESGYHNEDWIINIPLDDIPVASKILHRLNSLSESELISYQHRAQKAIKDHYNWDRFAQQVIDCIESTKFNLSVSYSDVSKQKLNRRVLAKIAFWNKIKGRRESVRQKISKIHSLFSKFLS